MKIQQHVYDEERDRKEYKLQTAPRPSGHVPNLNQI